MSAQNAKEAAEEIIARLRLPAEATGRKVQLVSFTSDEDCRYFYPRRALDWQRQVNTYISRALRDQHRIRVQRTVLAPGDYEAWRKDQPDSPELRRKFADEHIHLIG